LTQTQLRSFANFNTFTVQGRVSHAEIVNSKNGTFLAVTLISNALNDDEGMTITFNSSNGLLSLFEKGYLPTGRMLVVTGHIAYVRETYTDKSGEIAMLKRPSIHLVDAQVPTGGLGALPSKEDSNSRHSRRVVRPSDAQKEAAVVEEKAPTLEPIAF